MTQAPHSEKKIGIIDLGSNSARLLLVQVLPNGAYSIINRVKHMVRLGENAFETGYLQESAMQRTLIVLCSFMDMCRTYGVSEMLPMATAAMRDALNAQDFVKHVRFEADLELQIIPGQEEARLIYLGVSSGLPYSLGKRIFIDIGGGSTEVAIGNSVTYESLDSLKLGCVRLTNRFLANTKDKVSTGTFARMCQHVRNAASHTIAQVKNQDIKEMVASSGTALALHNISHRLQYGTNPASDQNTLTLHGLKKAAKFIRELTAEERYALPGISSRRAEVLVAGSAILLTLMEEFGFHELTISTRNLQDGILMDYVNNLKSLPDSTHIHKTNVREHSVLQLAKRCHFVKEHTEHMVHLALGIHDSAVDLGLIQLNHQARELLYYAGLLHDIGIFISYAKHAVHGAYIIKNTELLGFTQEEIEFMAQLTQRHNMKPHKKNGDTGIAEKGLAVHQKLFSLFLSLAESMDRLHCQNIQEAYLAREGDDIFLNVCYNTKSPIEADAVKALCSLFKKIIFKDIYARFIPAEQPKEYMLKKKPEIQGELF